MKKKSENKPAKKTLVRYTKPHTCFKCGKVIDGKSNYLKLITMNHEKVIEEVWFHLTPPCWSQFNDEKVNARIIELQKFGLNMLQKAGMVTA